MEVVGSLILVAAFVTLGAMAFLALGYVIASFAKTEDSANGMTSMIQFPMMFLSGAFFQIDQMPQFLQVVARMKWNQPSKWKLHRSPRLPHRLRCRPLGSATRSRCGQP